MPTRHLPRPILAALAIVTMLAGALAAQSPAAAVGLVLMLALAVVLTRLPLPQLGRIAVLAAVVAAILGPNLALPQAPQAFAFRILIVMLAAGALVFTLAGGEIVIPGALRRPGSLLLGLLAWAMVSIAWSHDQVAAVRWTLFLAMMSALAIAVAVSCRRVGATHRLMTVLGVTFLLSTVVAIAQLKFGLTLPTTTILGSGDSEFASSLFGNQNNFATYLTLTLPYFLCLPVVMRDTRLVLLGVAGTVITLTALMFTGSRSNLIAATLVVAGLAAWSMLARRSGARWMALAIAGIAVALVLPSVVGRGVLPIPQSAIEKFDITVLLDQQRAQTGSGAVRTAVLEGGLTLVRDSSGLGVGAGNAEPRLQELDTYTGVENLHNWWMEVLVNLGVPGLFIFVALYLHLMVAQLRAARRSQDPLVQWLGLSGGLALVGFVVGSMGPSSVIHFAPMWITLGLGMLTLVHAKGRRT